ncbi:MAG: hypothetical protein PUJ51_13500 [Clostridiales bacterium]|uniref:hypothetical protein n=1 Tax=Terrisporobacter sp. TaxID=1965305 RepID=UPI002A524AD9|nr:hypothetical protein [Terrisporobacter sp.]MDD7755501.1 hypothetical protein [Clostridiales bacterium]MDY4133923.1 hypothetical protein [Terrisporobacter sp.]
MGAIQSAINRTIGTVTAISKLASFNKEKMVQANKRALQQKQVRNTQKSKYVETNIGLLPVELVSKAEEVKPNGR